MQRRTGRTGTKVKLKECLEKSKELRNKSCQLFKGLRFIIGNTVDFDPWKDVLEAHGGKVSHTDSDLEFCELSTDPVIIVVDKEEQKLEMKNSDYSVVTTNEVVDMVFNMSLKF